MRPPSRWAAYHCNMFQRSQAQHLLNTTLAEISLPDGSAATDCFSGLREVDAKAREIPSVSEATSRLSREHQSVCFHSCIYDN